MRSSFLWAFTAFAAFQVTLGAPAAQAVSKTARCGASFGVTCRGSTFGNCCSEHGYCGSTSAYCGKGCQSGYGACNAASPVSNPPATPKISKNGKCGGDSGAVCLGSAFGDCCRYVRFSTFSYRANKPLVSTVGVAGRTGIVMPSASHNSGHVLSNPKQRL
jgi:hypothetical protein